MPRRKVIKPYAVDIARELRKDNDKRQPMAFIDLADVEAIKPAIVISPHHENVDYEEDYLIFQIDPDTLRVGDTVVMGRDPGGQPIIIGSADISGGHVANEVRALRQTVSVLSETTATGDFLPLSGGTLSGDLIMDPGTMITLPDSPVDPSDVVNKAYVDALFAICCSGGGGALIPTVTIDATDSTPCYNALPGDQVILVDTSLGPVSVCLPASHVSGKLYEIKDISGGAFASNITVYSDDGDLVDGGPSYIITVNYQAITVISDGTDWFVF